MAEFLPLLKCSVCLEIYDAPKTLPCAHTFCLSCVEQMVLPSATLRCPECRKTHYVPGGGPKNFPPNPVAMGLLDKLCQYCRSDEICGGSGSKLCQKCQSAGYKPKIIPNKMPTNTRIPIVTNTGTGNTIPSQRASRSGPDDINRMLPAGVKIASAQFMSSFESD